MSLKSWAENGWLRPHQTSSREIADLLKIVDRDLLDARAGGLSEDWKFGCRIKRNAAEYDRTGVASAKEAGELSAFVEEFLEDVLRWLGENHPGWMPGDKEN